MLRRWAEFQVVEVGGRHIQPLAPTCGGVDCQLEGKNAVVLISRSFVVHQGETIDLAVLLVEDHVRTPADDAFLQVKLEWRSVSQTRIRSLL